MDLKRKRGKIVRDVTITILVIFIIYVTYGSIVCLNKEKEEKNKYKLEIIEFLESKYSQKFEVKFFRRGYKKQEHKSLDGSRFYWGNDKEVDAYFYEFSPLDNPDIICYVAYYDYKNLGKSEIKEITEHHQIFNIFVSREVDSYHQILTWVDGQNETKKSINQYLMEDCIINESNYHSPNLAVISNRKVKKIIEEDETNFINMIDNIINEKSYEYKSLYIKYVDYKIEIFGNYSAKIGRETFKSGSEIVEYIKSR